MTAVDSPAGLRPHPSRPIETGGNERAKAAIARKMLEEFERELPTTRAFLRRVPPDRLTWKPHEKSMAVGQLALHIAQLPAATLAFALPDESVAPDFSAGWPQPRTLQEVLDALESSAAEVRRIFPTIDDGAMARTFKVMQSAGGRALMSLPREEFLRSILLNHWYHHRAQLGVYIRLLGAAVPAAYGPSADESPY